MIEINLEKLDRGTKTEWRTVTRDGKSFKQRFRTGKKEVTEFKDGKGIPAFDSYSEALEYVDNRAKDFSSKNEFYTSDEYKKLYPILQEVHKREIGEWSKDAKKAMKSVGVKFGDKVQYTYVGSFMSSESYTGVIVNRDGIPYVKLDPGQSTIDGKKSARWHKGWKI